MLLNSCRVFLECRISSNNSHPSIKSPPSNNCSPLMEIFKIIAPSPHPPSPISPSSLFFIPSLSSWSRIWSSKTDQWRCKLWKLIKESNLEHLKSPCSVYLMWHFFIYFCRNNKTKIFRARLPVSNIWNNRPLLMRRKEIIVPDYYSRKYGPTPNPIKRKKDSAINCNRNTATSFKICFPQFTSSVLQYLQFLIPVSAFSQFL